MTTVSIRNTVKRFGTVEVIHGLSMEIASGEFVVFVGPSGCGKSTLLRMIAGLESFQHGEIAIDGRVVNAVPARDRDIAMVFQDYALYPHMTVEGNMGFGLKMRGIPRPDIDRRVQAAARILQIEHLLARRPRELSGGQRQRVAMGRAIVREPKVFLFDEPLSNLDAKLRVDMRTEIKRLHQHLGATMVYVTHDQVEAMTLADRIVVLHGGRIEQIGTPRELYQAPETRFVAGFIGAPAMNFLPARIAGDHAELPGGFRLPLGRRVVAGAAELGIRPEHLVQLAAGAPGLPSRIEVVEPLGADTLVTARIGDTPVVARLSGDAVVAPGETLVLGLDPARAHLFDAKTGRRL
ncbi:MAG: sn-glycerol-3-phosphate ABC transporter ATP-binding protein UgpC [Alphaproteobacteria bacterium]|nr:sn-glycerol-3-phosphate ABC transporter ATP-binding protein UgpC [Alphaproteobacteria bacterium]